MMIGLKRPQMQILSKRLEVNDTIPNQDMFDMTKQYAVMSFIRHTGCPFAEETIKELRSFSDSVNDVDIFVIYHGDKEVFDKWINTVGGYGHLKCCHDPGRKIYGSFGIGYSHVSHFLGLKSLLGVLKLLPKGIRNRTASGSRWQKASTFIIDNSYKVVWCHNPLTANDVLKELEIKEVMSHYAH